MRSPLLLTLFVAVFFFGGFLQVDALDKQDIDRIRSLGEQIDEQESKIANYQSLINVSMRNEKATKSDKVKQLGEYNSLIDAAQEAIDKLTAEQDKLTAPLLNSNLQCTPFEPKCGCKEKWIPPTLFSSGKCVGGGPSMRLCECYELVETNPNVIDTGICVKRLTCETKTYTDIYGNKVPVGSPSSGPVSDIFKGLLGKLQGSLGGGGGGSPGDETDENGCTEYRVVSVPSSDPCTTYSPSGTDPETDQTSCTTIDRILGKCGTDGQQCPAIQNVTCGQGFERVSGGVAANSCKLQDTCEVITDDGSSATSASDDEQPYAGDTQTVQINSNIFSGVVTTVADFLSSGTRGDIQVTGSGATIFGGSRDNEAGTEVAGFYGSDSLGGTPPQGLAARMCQGRPWSDSFVSYVIPPTFFDGLCTWRGYQVGFPEVIIVPPPPVVQQTPPPPVVNVPATPTVDPEVDIWASPASVSLGGRTSIFWNTQGVVSCSVTSSGGNFSENALSGGAATVPITDTTIFTISCLTSDNVTVTDDVEVNLAI